MTSLFHKARKVPCEALMNESPSVIGMMCATIGSGGSLDTAVRDVAANGPPGLSALFAGVVTDSDSRVRPDIKEGVEGMLSRMDGRMKPFVRSMHMLIAAADSVDAEERARMTKDANDMALRGLKEMGETYSSALNTPCMLIFGLGIMVPMILMSVLPMLSMGSLFGMSSIDPMAITVVTLVAVPAAVACVIVSLKGKNPFVDLSATDACMGCAIPLVISAPAGFAVWKLTGDLFLAVVGGVCAGGAATFLSMVQAMRSETARKAGESALKDCIIEMGNRLVSGANFQVSVVDAIRSRKECAAMADSLERELSICRGDERGAIMSALGGCSPRMAGMFCDVRSAADKNMRDAGRLAISVGRQLQDQASVRKDIDNKLKSMLDMMTGTAMFFAPLVLGLSVAMLGPLSSVAEGIDPTGTTLTLTVYLVELCALMSVLTTNLTGNSGFRNAVYRFSMMAPVAMAVFAACTLVSF